MHFVQKIKLLIVLPWLPSRKQSELEFSVLIYYSEYFMLKQYLEMKARGFSMHVFLVSC